ncbi:hypothetical protein Bca52824_079346 [Brassica carinata]|uniref:Uncharacterized protein n=1 Tax=Brassica carinata TaxID=52824 RepID=A0A8X7Q031_BRACI|nr:hypothetical protein Bca52824_079346 [Brassica carinata]
MNLPSSTSVTSASDPDTSPENSPETCEGCGIRDSWVTHSRDCLLRKHRRRFALLLRFYDSPPHDSFRFQTPLYRCPLRDPDSSPSSASIIDANGVSFVDKSLSGAFLCAAKISASSMNKAVSFAKCEAERKGKDAAVARKRAREALDDVIKLDEKAKSDVEFSANRDQKPSLSPASTNSYQLKKPKADHPSVK